MRFPPPGLQGACLLDDGAPMRRSPLRLILLLALVIRAAGAERPVSFSSEVRPILRRSCTGCHQPSKAKGGLDLSTHAALLRGGKHGPAVRPGDPEKSRLVQDVSGAEPAMPDEGDPLTQAERRVLSQWVAQGALDDTPPGGVLHQLKAPPVYDSLPSVAAMAWSPDGGLLAVAGWHEVLLHSAPPRSNAPPRVAGRLVGHSPRIESIAFSPDGRLLATSGGAPSEYGEIQVWEVATRTLVRSIRATTDVFFGISWSPDQKRLAVGGADKMVRVFSAADGTELMRCDNHIDWVFGTSWSRDGLHLVTAGRDRALKLIDVATGHLIDDINRPTEALLSLARHPSEDLVACGSDKGEPRLYRIEPRGGRLGEGDDKEAGFVRPFDRLPGGIQALGWSPDGSLLAAGSTSGELRIYKTSDGRKVCSPRWAGGPVFTLGFRPAGDQLAVAGYDGWVRLFDATTGTLIQEFPSVPLTPTPSPSRNNPSHQATR
mgnify:FL=1